MTNWVKVSDRLPEKEGTYFVVCAGRRATAEYSSLEWSTESYFDSWKGTDICFSSFFELTKWTQENITHWQELPEVPNE